MRATRKTPAATIVAAWIIAETGVGPAIASGSQTWSGNCADLPAAPPKISSAIVGSTGSAKSPAMLQCASASASIVSTRSTSFRLRVPVAL